MKSRFLIAATMMVAMLGAGVASASETQPDPNQPKSNQMSNDDSKMKSETDSRDTRCETKKERKAREKREKQERKQKQDSNDEQPDSTLYGGGA